MIIIAILLILFLVCAVISVMIFNKEDFKNIKWIQKINKSVFPIISVLLIALLLACYTSGIFTKKYDYNYNYNASSSELVENESNLDDEYQDTNYNDSEYSNIDFTTQKPEKVTLYTGVHIGGADIVAGSYIASTTSSRTGNLFVYDDKHFLAYHEFYTSGNAENKQGSPVYIDNGSEIKISGVSSVTFTPIAE